MSVYFQETEQAEFERKRREWEQQAEAKTAKNRAKRQKKKGRSKGKGGDEHNQTAGSSNTGESSAPLKKRRLVNGQELVFRRPGEESDEEDEDQGDVGPMPNASRHDDATSDQPPAVPIVDAQRIVIHEED